MSATQTRWLLLHGTPMTPQVWATVAAALTGQERVTCPLLSHAAGTRGGQQALARRLVDELAPGAELHVAGHSFGGQVALDVALTVPDRVRTLTIVCSRDTPFPPFAAVAASLRRGEPVDTAATLARWFTPSELAADDPVVQYVRHCLAEVDPLQWADDLDSIAVYDRSDIVGALAMPVTLVAAELDHVATVPAMTELADRLPDAQLHVLNGAAHMSPFTRPSVLAELLSEAAARGSPKG